VILFHPALSLRCFLHRLIPVICISSSISTIHLFLGLPLILVPIGFHSNILLGNNIIVLYYRWAGHVARMGEDRGVHRVLVGTPEEKMPDVDGRMILR
jgi:hypothetical protein